MSSHRPTGRTVGRDRRDHQRRDAALERTRSITKAVGVASVAAVAAFGIYVSRALPGHAATTTGTATTGSTSTSSTGSTSTTVTPSPSTPVAGTGSTPAPSPTQLTPPTSPPVTSPKRAPVVSGSS